MTPFEHTTGAELAALDFSEEFARWGTQFVGREKLFERIDVGLKGAKHFILLTGGPGIGKSALAAQLTQRRSDVVAYHFCIDGRIATVTSSTILRSLAAQLARSVPGYAEALAANLRVNRSVSVNINVGQLEANGSVVGIALKNLATSSADEDLEILLRAPLAAIKKPPARAVIVMDGLDEAIRHGGASNLVALLGQLGDLPKWVRMFCTTQPTEEVLHLLDFLHPETISMEQSASSDDIPRYAVARISQALLADRVKPPAAAHFVSEIARLADGNFLFAKLLLDDIEVGTLSHEHFDELPSNLDESYRRYLVRISGADWDTAYQPIFGKLAVAQEALNEPEIARFSGLAQGAVRRSLSKVDRFLNSVQRNGQPFYRLYHNSFKTFLLDSTRARSFWCDPVEENSRIAESYGRADVKQWDEYGVRYLPWHIAKSNAPANLRNLLLSYPWLETKLQKSSVQEVLGDFELAQADEDLHTVASVLRLSAGAVATDPGQLWIQIFARTMTVKNPLAYFPPNPKGSWVKPLGPTLRQANDPLLWTLRGHARSVRSLVVRRDSGVLVTSDVDGLVRFWDIAKGMQVRPPFLCEGHTKFVTLSPRGDEVAGVNSEGGVQVWNLDTGQAVNRFDHPGAVWVEFSEDQPWLTTQSTDPGTRLWDRRVGTWKPLPDHGLDCCFIPGTTLAVARATWDFTVFDVPSGDVLHHIKMGGASVDGDPLAVSRDGRLVATSGGDFIKVLDLKTGNCVDIEVTGRVATIESLAFNADGSKIVSGSRGNRYQRGYQVQIWDMATGRCLKTFHGHTSNVGCVGFSEDGCFVISSGYDRKLLVWDMGGSPHESRRHQNSVTDIVINNSGMDATTASDDGDLLEWNVPQRAVEHTIPLNVPVEHLAISGNGDIAALGFLYYYGEWGSDFESKVFVFSPGKQEPVKLVEYSGGLRKQRYEAAQFTQDSRILVLARQQDESDTYEVARIELWDWARKRLVRQIEYTDTRLSRMLLLPDSLKLLTADKRLAIWDLTETQPSPHVFVASEGSTAVTLAVSPNGRTLAVGRNDGSIELWDLNARTKVQSMPAHDGAVGRVVFKGNGRDLISLGRDDGCLKVWKQGKLHALLLGDDFFSALAITPAGGVIVGDEHGRVHFIEICE